MSVVPNVLDNPTISAPTRTVSPVALIVTVSSRLLYGGKSMSTKSFRREIGSKNHDQCDDTGIDDNSEYVDGPYTIAPPFISRAVITTSTADTLPRYRLSTRPLVCTTSVRVSVASVC